MATAKKKVSASGNDVKILELARKHGLSVDVVQDIVSSYTADGE